MHKSNGDVFLEKFGEIPECLADFRKSLLVQNQSEKDGKGGAF